MLYLDFEGKNEKEATQLALDTLGLEMEDVKIEIIEKGNVGLFGLGRQVNAVVRVYYQEKNDIVDMVDKIKRIIEKIDEGVYFDVNYTKEDRYIINVDSVNPGPLIGKNGQNLQSIQNIVNVIAKMYNNKYKVIIDVNFYNKKQNSRILKEAKELAKQVQEIKEEKKLGIFNPFLRRLIHLEIKKIDGVKSYSRGEGKEKEIFIAPE